MGPLPRTARCPAERARRMPSPPIPVVIVPGRPGLTRLDIDALTLLRISHRLCARLLHLEHAGGARLSRIILTELSAFGARMPAPSLAQHPRRASRSFPCAAFHVPLVPRIVASVCLCVVCSRAEDAPRRRGASASWTSLSPSTSASPRSSASASSGSPWSCT